VLVSGAATLSRGVDPRDRGTCILFGDGAAAVVLAPTSDEGPGILGWDTGCDGSATGLLGIPAGGSRLPATPDTIDEGLQYIKMQGQEVFRRAVRAVVDSAALALDRAGVTADDIDWFIPHQANLRIIEAAASRLAIGPERTIVNIDQFGNTSAASIPLALAEAADAGRFHDGDLILMSGFGAGMSWGSAIVRWGRA
jgi:3-oxoacyl-[acyl-carrier-protein] synthase-3